MRNWGHDIDKIFDTQKNDGRRIFGQESAVCVYLTEKTGLFIKQRDLRWSRGLIQRRKLVRHNTWNSASKNRGNHGTAGRDGKGPQSLPIQSGAWRMGYPFVLAHRILEDTGYLHIFPSCRNLDLPIVPSSPNLVYLLSRLGARSNTIAVPSKSKSTCCPVMSISSILLASSLKKMKKLRGCCCEVVVARHRVSAKAKYRPKRELSFMYVGLRWEKGVLSHLSNERPLRGAVDKKTQMWKINIFKAMRSCIHS